MVAAGYSANNTTFDVFKYVDQLIGTNNYGKCVSRHRSSISICASFESDLI